MHSFIYKNKIKTTKDFFLSEFLAVIQEKKPIIAREKLTPRESNI